MPLGRMPIRTNINNKTNAQTRAGRTYDTVTAGFVQYFQRNDLSAYFALENVPEPTMTNVITLGRYFDFSHDQRWWYHGVCRYDFKHQPSCPFVEVDRC